MNKKEVIFILKLLSERLFSQSILGWHKAALGAARLHAAAPFFAPASVMESRRAGIGMILLAS